MRMDTRRMLDRAFSATGIFAILLMVAFLLVVLAPILQRGAGAYVFRGTIEHRRFVLENFNRGNAADVADELAACRAARAPVYQALAAFDAELPSLPAARRRELKAELKELRAALAELLGPPPGSAPPALLRSCYGQTRWERAEIKLQAVLEREVWDYSQGLGRKVRTPRERSFAGTALAPVFPYLRVHARDMLRPRLTCYGGFLTDRSMDAHFFGGIGPEVLGTLYLTLGAMLLAVPIGVVAAIYFQEYAADGRTLTFLRSCVSTLAGVPSIVFGLFGLAFFINTIRVSPSKSVLAGSLTLALLVLPTVIRASEEAIRAVPRTYKEAALALGAGRWHTIMTVVLPAALPGILTGVVISMGRAAGETAPIIFTAAVSQGAVPRLTEVLSHATPALPWSIYNLCTEHEAVDEIRHVQYGMVATLVVLVIVLNLAAILLRARVTRRLKG
jgi:phosphate transport system permease protein